MLLVLFSLLCIRVFGEVVARYLFNNPCFWSEELTSIPSPGVARLSLTIGALTPPVGVYRYIMTRAANMSFEDVVKAVLPSCIPLMVVLMLISFFPELVLWLPRVLGFITG
jgi:TRAP-type C4-dicarboxylate transport system permease large subunit